MKKSVILILLCVTLVFIGFVSGVYVGRNFSYGDIIVRDENPVSTTAPSSKAPVTDPAGGTHSSQSGSMGTTPTTKPLYPININTATAEELDLLPGIGPVLAKAIIDYRTEYGPFSTPEDLDSVPGIGPKILAKILPYITV